MKEERKYNKPVFSWGNAKENTIQYKNRQFEELTAELNSLKAEAEVNKHSIKKINTRYLALLLWEMRTQGLNVFDKKDYKGKTIMYNYFEKIRKAQEKETIEEVIKPFLYINCFPESKCKYPIYPIQ